MYRISLYTNSVLSVLFILLAIISTLNIKAIEPATLFVLLFIFFAFGIFLLFDLLCFRILALNREKLPCTGRVKNYSKIIFVLAVLALLSMLIIAIAAAYALFTDTDEFPIQQRPFFILFLFLLLLSAVTFVFNAVAYFRSIKENKDIMSACINEIGS